MSIQLGDLVTINVARSHTGLFWDEPRRRWSTTRLAREFQESMEGCRYGLPVYLVVDVTDTFPITPITQMGTGPAFGITCVARQVWSPRSKGKFWVSELDAWGNLYTPPLVKI